jgi:hypothetical protein
VPDKRHIFISLLMLSVLLVQSQEIKINGGFIEDSLQLGSTVHYWVTAEYPMEIEVLFADSNYNFSPFEYADKFFVETELRNDNAFDSVVYGFQSFEIDLIQKLQLPVFVVQSNDSIVLTTPLDSLFFEELVPLRQVSDTTQLIQNTQYNPVVRLFNYPLMWIIVGILLVISLMIFFIFGQKIRNYFTIRRLKKEYGLFSNFISQSINVLKESVDRERAAQSLTQWKNYLERIELQPFSKLTTKEILALEFTSELKEALRNIDKNVYGNHRDPELYKSFQDIEDFTQHRFHMKIEDIKNGK